VSSGKLRIKVVMVRCSSCPRRPSVLLDRPLSLNGRSPEDDGAEPPNPKSNPPSPGDGGGFDTEATELDETKPESGGGGRKVVSKWNRPKRSRSFVSSFSSHENVDGAEEGPGEIASLLPGVELPLARSGLISGLIMTSSTSSPGSGAVLGSLAGISIASTERVMRCLVGLLPDFGRRLELGVIFLLATSF